MREIEFRGKGKNGEWYYGNLIVANDTDRSKHYYIITNEYSDRDNGMPNTIELDTCNSPEVEQETVGQYVGTGEDGRIYEGMKLYDEYEKEYCTVEYDEEECRFGLVYDGYETRIYTLDGLRIAEED